MPEQSLRDFRWPSFRPPLESYKLDYGIGIVGYAGIVRAQQLPAYRLAGYRVAAAADIRAERRELAKRDGIPQVYEDYRELMRRDDVDIIDCAVDHSTPADMAAREAILTEAAKAGKAVLMQKPMATDLETAGRMVRIAEEAGIPFAVNQNLRFDPAIYLTKQLLAPECFGRPGYLHLANISIEGPKFGFGPEGVVMAWQIHAIDSIRWLAGGEPVSVYCTNQNHASLYQIQFSSGCVCNYFEYHNADNFRNETPLRVWAERGAVRANHRWNPGSRWEKDLVEARGYDWPKEIGWISCGLPDDLTFRDVFIAPRYDQCASIAGFIGMMGEFMQSLAEKRPALTNARDNLMSLRMYFAGQASAEKKRPVDPRSMAAL
ncbi:MAG: Gfo/Idh/MocA family oxidoreductase [Bryobacterales bacterium]|nr:Gfo/Idh/MocA family oxidoreductase [Bryobacterales bacterium]